MRLRPLTRLPDEPFRSAPNRVSPLPFPAGRSLFQPLRSAPRRQAPRFPRRPATGRRRGDGRSEGRSAGPQGGRVAAPQPGGTRFDAGNLQVRTCPPVLASDALRLMEDRSLRRLVERIVADRGRSDRPVLVSYGPLGEPGRGRTPGNTRHRFPRHRVRRHRSMRARGGPPATHPATSDRPTQETRSMRAGGGPPATRSKSDCCNWNLFVQ